MTTLAYSKKENKIAVDGRTTCNDIVISDDIKKWREGNDGAVYFTAGTVGDAKKLIELFESGERKSEVPLECTLIRASEPPMIIGLSEGEIYSDELDEDFRAIGSGGNWATAANDFGKNVKDCVKYASTKDIYSGGKISVYDLTKQRFLK